MESEIKSKKRGQVSESKVSHILITKIIYGSQNAPFLILLAPYLRLVAIFARFVHSKDRGFDSWTGRELCDDRSWDFGSKKGQC